MSPASRQARFLAPKQRFTLAELRYLTELDGIDHVAYVALRADAPRELVAVGRMVRLNDDPRAAEIAIAVCDAWQRRGVGTLLGDILATAARDRDIRWLTATMADDNPAMPLRDRDISCLTATMAAENEAAHPVFNHVSTQLHERHDGAVDEL